MRWIFDLAKLFRMAEKNCGFVAQPKMISLPAKFMCSGVWPQDLITLAAGSKSWE
jgi:hypothetical protein